MKIVAFLQCQWFKNPERARAIYAKENSDHERRAKLNGAYLFFSSLTGKRLYAAFGEWVRFDVVWEESTKEIGGHSSFNPPADPAHIESVIAHFKPDVILTFGKRATESVSPIAAAKNIRVISGPHPAARHATVVAELKAMADELRSMGVPA